MFLVAFDMAAILRAALPFIGILVVLVVLHELGHFIAAKAFGVKVLEFGVGFPPKIWGKKFGETEYTVNWLPIGGFVRLLGEEDPSDPRSLAAQARWKRLTVLYAGVGMNFLLAILLMAAGFMIPRERSLSLAQIVQVAPDSPAAEATIQGTMRDGSDPLPGLQPGDIVVEAAGRDIKNTTELVYAIRLNLGETQTWLINRSGSTLEADVYARWDPPKGEGNVGVRIGAPASCSDIDDEGNPTNCTLLYPFTEKVSYNPMEALNKGFWALIESAILTKNELQMRLMGGGDGGTSSGPAFQGPVGIAAVTGDVIEQAGWRSLIEISALLSLNLAVFNMLPLPMLDGGRAFIIFI
ncbi:MAG: site-2 protease family protein, partial [Thermomicrobiales bacterium]|nr:site-2 protease family protein [Thermomicrobiales bacterium]